MASSILNSDDGVVSGTSGLKTGGGDDGILKIQTNGTDAVSVSAAQVCTFPNPPVMGVSGLTGDIAAARITNALNASGSAPIYAARAWVNFNGTGTVAIRASGNVSSITDNGTGDYTVNFTNAMSDANYSEICTGTGSGGSGPLIVGRSPNLRNIKSTTQIAVLSMNFAGTAIDCPELLVAIFR
jgi:hypothetical protein